MAYDEKFLEHLCFLTDMFYPNRFDVIILPNDTAGSIAFRGVLDKKWLRVNRVSSNRFMVVPPTV